MHNSPWKTIAIVLATLFVSEAAVMAVLYVLPVPHIWEILIDPILLSVMAGPILILLLMRPLKKSIIRQEQAEQAMKTLINAPDDVALLTEPDGRILIANETFANKLGRPRQELVGLNTFDLLPSTLAAGRKARVRHVAATGQPAHFEDIENGRWMENDMYPIKNSAGQVNQIVLLSRDITQFKQSESGLRTALGEQERMNRLMAGREGRILELKKQINDLLNELGKQPHYETTA